MRPRTLVFVALLGLSLFHLAAFAQYTNTFPYISQQYTSIWADHGTCGFPDTESRSAFSQGNSPFMARTCQKGMPDRQFLSGHRAYSGMDFNGHGGTVVGGYFSAEGVGQVGPHSFGNEIVGIYARATSRVAPPVQYGAPWLVAVHGEIEMWTQTPGTGAVFNAEIYDRTWHGSGIEAHGLIVNPKENVRNVTGITLLQNAPAGQTNYKHGIRLAGTSVEFARINDVSFCQEFNFQLQRVEFWRGCDKHPSFRTLHFVIPMHFESRIQ